MEVDRAKVRNSRTRRANLQYRGVTSHFTPGGGVVLLLHSNNAHIPSYVGYFKD